jgi:hypothetical protein
MVRYVLSVGDAVLTGVGSPEGKAFYEVGR